MERTGWSGMESFPKERIPKQFGIPTTPSAPLRWLRIFFWRNHPSYISRGVASFSQLL